METNKSINTEISSLVKIWRKILNISIKYNICFVILLYLIITLFISWPLILHLDRFLLSTDYKDISHADTLGHITIMQDSRDLFFQHKDIITGELLQGMPLTYVVSGIVVTGILNLNEVFFHNLFFLCCIFLSGLFMYYLMYELSKDTVASFFSGFLYMSSNYIFYEYFWGHTNIMQIQWIPLIFLFLEKTINHNKLKHAIFLGFSFFLQIISSEQYTVYLSFIIPMYIFMKAYFTGNNFPLSRHFWKNIGISIGVAFVSSFFYLIRRIQIPSIIRTVNDNRVYNWTMHSFSQLFQLDSSIYLGIFPFILVVCGIVIIVLNFEHRKYRQYLPFEILFIFLIACMFGTVSYFAPYFWLYKIWPFVKYFRVPLRLFPLVLMCSSVLASLCLLYLKEVNKLKKFRIPILIMITLLIVICQILPRLSNNYIFYLID